VAKLINEGLLFACVVAFVLITIAGLLVPSPEPKAHEGCVIFDLRQLFFALASNKTTSVAFPT
jgi:hypothetical protein